MAFLQALPTGNTPHPRLFNEEMMDDKPVAFARSGRPCPSLGFGMVLQSRMQEDVADHSSGSHDCRTGPY